MLLGAIGAGVREGWFLAHAGHAQGTVVSVATSYSGGVKGGRGNLTYRPTLAFTDAADKAWTFDSGRFGLVGGKVGGVLPVVYEASNPAHAQIESFWGQWDPTFTFGYVAVFALVLRWLVRLGMPPDRDGTPHDPAILAGP